jgi:hypothetical protein
VEDEIQPFLATLATGAVGSLATVGDLTSGGKSRLTQTVGGDQLHESPAHPHEDKRRDPLDLAGFAHGLAENVGRASWMTEGAAKPSRRIGTASRHRTHGQFVTNGPGTNCSAGPLIILP